MSSVLDDAREVLAHKSRSYVQAAERLAEHVLAQSCQTVVERDEAQAERNHWMMEERARARVAELEEELKAAIEGRDYAKSLCDKAVARNAELEAEVERLRQETEFIRDLSEYDRDPEVIKLTIGPPSVHRRGMRVRNREHGWEGVIDAVECLVCSCSTQDADGRHTCGHVNGYSLLINQNGYLKPWCRVEDYEVLDG